MKSKFEELVFLARKKGLKYTYNKLYFDIFWDWIRGHPSLIRLLNRFAPYPSYIEVEVTTRCNLRCVMCEHTYWNEPPRDMSFEEFKGIIDQFPALKWIGLTGIGESFMNRDFMKMLEYVKKKGVFVELFDNLYLVDEKTSEKLIDLGVDKLLMSIDAATAQTYEKIREGSRFDRVIKHVRNLYELKKAKGAHFPQISFHYIVNKYNLHEMPQFLDLVESITQGERTSVMFTILLHKYKEVEDIFVDVPEEMIRKVEEKAKKLAIDITWSLDIPHDKPSLDRCIEWTMPFIFVTGHVIPCCAGNEANGREYQKDTAMGNVFEQSFKQIWRGKKYGALRDMLLKRQLPRACVKCCIYELRGKKCAS
jgi:MoaA/NifB/PqqE/SkfB family radical SAM enzyme